MDKAKEEAALKIFSRVLKEVKPSPSEIKEVTAHVNLLTKTLGKIVPASVKLHVAGSVARGTNLRGSADIDIFMLFERRWSKSQVEKLGLEYGKKLSKALKGRYEVKYAEHPYLRIHFDRLKLRSDVVPAFRIDEIDQMGTAVDRTPLHTKFINSKLNDRQRDEVRLLKFLLKAHRIYGAEVKTNGFSGYLCELLIHHYGSLPRLLEAASAFRPPIILNPKDSSSMINKSDELKKFHSEFIVIDPVDRNRNVAAGVSTESLARFVIVAREFTSNPRESIFRGSLDYATRYKSVGDFLGRTGLESFLIEFKISKESEDVVFPQLRKLSNIISDHAERYGFIVYLAVPFVSETHGYILMLAPRMELKTRLLKGPEAFIPHAPAKFLDAHRNGSGFVLRGSSILSLDCNEYDTLRALISPATISRMSWSSKDVKLSSAKVHHNKVPDDVEELAFSELQKKLYL